MGFFLFIPVKDLALRDDPAFAEASAFVKTTADKTAGRRGDGEKIQQAADSEQRAGKTLGTVKRRGDKAIED